MVPPGESRESVSWPVWCVCSWVDHRYPGPTSHVKKSYLPTFVVSTTAVTCRSLSNTPHSLTKSHGRSLPLLCCRLHCRSPPLARSHNCQQLTLSVCHTKHQIDSSFLVSRWNWAIFWPPILHDPLYKTLFFDFGFVAMAPKFGLFFHKIEIDSFFLSRWNRAILAVSSLWPLYKTFSSIFDLGPLTPKIYSPKFAQNRL